MTSNKILNLGSLKMAFSSYGISTLNIFGWHNIGVITGTVYFVPLFKDNKRSGFVSVN